LSFIYFENKCSKKNSQSSSGHECLFLYEIDANANRARIKAENPDAKFTELPGIASAEFKSLSKKEASKWHKAAAEDKARYRPRNKV
jgi:hypothetical protein